VIVGFCSKYHALYWSQHLSLCVCVCVCVCVSAVHSHACQEDMQQPRINKSFPYICLVIACLLLGVSQMVK